MLEKYALVETLHCNCESICFS